MRKINSKCKQCRREGVKLFIKGEKCNSAKCAMIKKNYVPGVHGPKKQMSKASTYAKQLREKQKTKRIYGMLETQFSNLVKKAIKSKKDAGTTVMQLLESRFDNVVYRLHLASSRNSAKQLINHGHFKINGKSVNIPSYAMKVGDKITIKENKIADKYWDKVKKSANTLAKDLPTWLSLDIKDLSSQVTAESKIDGAEQVNTALIIEFYSR